MDLLCLGEFSQILAQGLNCFLIIQGIVMIFSDTNELHFTQIINKQQMKINFDELFSQTLPLSALPASFSQTELPKANHQHHNSNEEAPSKPRPNIIKTERMTIGSQKESTHSILQKLNKLTKMIETQQLPVRKHTKVNIQELTKKLYQPPPSAKKNCTKKVKPTAKQQPIETTRKQVVKGSKQQKRIINQSQFPRYVRLYNLSKINSIRSLYRTQSHEAELDRKHFRQQLKTKASESYLENYVPFYDRLESEVNRSQQKLKFYQNNPQLSCGESKELFKPTTIPDKYKNRVQSRYNKESSKETKTTNQIQQMMNSSINTSFYSLDRSLEIVNKVEEHFFDKMKVVFQNKEDDYVTINEDVVLMLSEIQFKILQNFIMQVESNPITNEEFQFKLKDYYYNLPAHERLELRSHQAMKRKNAKANQAHFSQRDKDILSAQSFKKKSEKVSTYHKKVQSYI